MRGALGDNVDVLIEALTTQLQQLFEFRVSDFLLSVSVLFW